MHNLISLLFQPINPVSGLDPSVLISSNGVAIALTVVVSTIVLVVVYFLLRSYARLLDAQSAQIKKLEEGVGVREARIDKLQVWKEEALPAIARLNTIQDDFKDLNARFNNIETERSRERVEYKITLAGKNEIIAALTAERDDLKTKWEHMTERIGAIEDAANLYPLMRDERDGLEFEIATLKPRIATLERLLKIVITNGIKDFPPDLLEEITSALST